MHGSLHGPGYSGGSAVTAQPRPARRRPASTTDFHVFAVEWTPNQITWQVDDATCQVRSPRRACPRARAGSSTTRSSSSSTSRSAATTSAPPDGDTVFPQTLLVDYVRVYQGAP